VSVPHTPGPWEVGLTRTTKLQALTFIEIPVHVGGDGQTVGHGNALALVHLGGAGATSLNEPDVRANARLIAAAPELLEALRNLLDWGRQYTSPVQKNSPHSLLIKAHLAIAKAEGGGQ
jgi:hypothetical protein